ncbi:zinc finger protein 423 homolog [Galendromus occidentalis]|uniref:Zinc finger protein 423 homolog n=1 Tax=Galendromus occidentalis TaxID=34638 RepID=A0AAJ7WI84_9ACAR|nr:zinc finger protein 423 homolog [Galendromus occidentalis]
MTIFSPFHSQVHSDKMPFRCDYCQRLFKHKRSRDRHVKLHTGDKKYRCTQCESAFSRSDHLKIHMKTHDNAKPYQCSMCNRGYNTAAALTSHMQNHRKNTAEAQARDDRQRMSNRPTTNHRSDSANDSDTPLANGFRTDRLSRSPSSDRPAPLLSSPLDPFTSSPTPVCSLCSRSDFGTMENLQLHMRAAHSNFPAMASLMNKNINFNLAYLAAQRLSPTDAGTETYNCQYCRIQLPSPHALQTHTLQAHTINPGTLPHSLEFISKLFEARVLQMANSESVVAAAAAAANHSCPHCRIEMPSQAALVEHVRFAHTDVNGGGPFICPQCGQASPDFEAFRLHHASHLPPNKVSRVCPECNAEFGSSQQLETHVASHYLKQATEFNCSSCSKAFSEPEDLQKHHMEHHAQHLYRCSVCKKVCESKAEAQAHFSSKHSEKTRVYQCGSCNTNYGSEGEFSVHVQVTHLAKASPYRCLLCKQTFPSEPLLQRHVETHNRQFACSMCDQAFHVEYLLQKHMEAAHSTLSAQNLTLSKRTAKCDVCDLAANGVSLLCAYCNESCKSRSDLDNHMKLHQHGSSNGKHKCNICDEIFSNVSALAEHKLTHCKVTVGTTCAICRDILRTEKEFAEHVATHGGSGTGLPLPCVICKQTLMSEVELQIHAKFHIGSSSATSAEATKICEICHTQNDHLARAPNGKISCEECFAQGVKQSKIEKCSDCGVKFEGRIEFERHSCRKAEPSHKKIKLEKISCSDCHKTFDSAADLESHSKIHREIPSAFECKLCRGGFETATELQIHLIEHSFEGCPGFTCYLCSAIFTTARSLSSHITEHGSKPFDCTKCDMTFYFRAELENHELTEHLNRTPTPSQEERSALEPEVEMTEDGDDEELVVA